ncbi:MAG: hypothetical protein ACRD2L_06090, partial [Terriglobia bacterium]
QPPIPKAQEFENQPGEELRWAFLDVSDGWHEARQERNPRGHGPMIQLKNTPVLLDFPSQIESGRNGPRKTPTEMRP